MRRGRDLCQPDQYTPEQYSPTLGPFVAWPSCSLFDQRIIGLTPGPREYLSLRLYSYERTVLLKVLFFKNSTSAGTPNEDPDPDFRKMCTGSVPRLPTPQPTDSVLGLALPPVVAALRTHPRARGPAQRQRIASAGQQTQSGRRGIAAAPQNEGPGARSQTAPSSACSSPLPRRYGAVDR